MRTIAATTIALALLTLPLPTPMAHMDGMKSSTGFVCLPEGGPEVYVPLTSSGCAKLVVKTRDPVTTCEGTAETWRCRVVAHMELTVYGPLACGYGSSTALSASEDDCTDPDFTDLAPAPDRYVKIIESSEEESSWYTGIPASGKQVTFDNLVCVRPWGTSHSSSNTMEEDCITFKHTVHLPGPRSANTPLDAVLLDLAGYVTSFIP